MINFYDLIEEDFSFYSKKELSQIFNKIESDDNILTESSGSFIDKILNKLKMFFKKIKDFFKKWWNKLLKFLGIKENKQKGLEIKEVKIVDEVESITSKESKKIVEKIDEELKNLQVSKYVYRDTNKYWDEHENKMSDSEREELIKKYFNRDAKKFKNLEENINEYIDTNVRRNSVIFNNDTKDFNSLPSYRYLTLSFSTLHTGNTFFKSDEEFTQICKKILFKTNGTYKFYKLDIYKLYTSVEICNTYIRELNVNLSSINLCLNNIKFNNNGIDDIISQINKILNTDIEYDNLVKESISYTLNSYIAEDVSENPIFILSYLYKIMGINIIGEQIRLIHHNMNDEIVKEISRICKKYGSGDPDIIKKMENLSINIQSFITKSLSNMVNVVNIFAKLEKDIKTFAENNINEIINNINDYEAATPEERRDIWKKINGIVTN